MQDYDFPSFRHSIKEDIKRGDGGSFRSPFFPLLSFFFPFISFLLALAEDKHFIRCLKIIIECLNEPWFYCVQTKQSCLGLVNSDNIKSTFKFIFS